MTLHSRTAIVTGAARGIGAAIAQTLAQAGATLILADISPTIHELAKSLPNAHALQADITTPDGAEALAALAMSATGRLDILVNNAGIGMNKPFMDTTPDDMHRVMAVNLIGPMLCSQAALRRMLPAGYGRIVNVTSISGERGSAGRAAYGAAKAALALMTKVMTLELAGQGIAVNAVAPGAVETEMAAAIHSPATRAEFHARTPQGRYATPVEIAAAVLFLASDQAAYVNGQVLVVDGGLTSAGLVSP